MVRRSRRFLAVGFAVVVLLSAIVGGGVLAQEAGPLGEADEIYVDDNGDAVLVMADDPPDSEANLEFDVDVGSGILYGLVTAPVEDTGNVSGALTAAVSDEAFAAEGNLSAPRPDALESLELDVESVTNDQQSAFDGTLSTTFQSGSMSMLLQSASTQGEVTMGPDLLQAQGQFDVQSAAMAGPGTTVEFSLTEDDGTYRIELAQDRTIPEFAADGWRTREAAKERIQQQFVPVATMLGGQASVEISRHSFQQVGDGEYRLVVAYTATLQGVEDGLEQLLTSQLARQSTVDGEQAAAMAENLTALSINQVSFSLDTSGQGATGEFALDLENYGGLLTDYTSLASELQGSESALRGLERSRKAFQAQRAANMEQRVTWSAELSNAEPATTSMSAELHQEASNWGAYVSELEDRGITTYDTRYELSATTTAERIEMSGSASSSGEEMVSRFVDQALNASDLPESTAESLRTFEEADLEKAKFETVVDDDVRVEAAAKFADLTAFRDVVDSDTEVPPLSSVVGRTTDEATEIYVRVPSAVGEDASESEVREFTAVDEDTTVHMPGTWDREFPEPDTERANGFLALNESIGDGDGDGDGDGIAAGGPGFGIVAALAGLLAVALLAVRRDR
jgi:PGF-CTERM protein